MRNAMKKKLLSLLFVLMLFLCSCGSGSDSLAGSRPGSLVFGEGSSNGEFSYDQVPEYDGQPYAVINNNVPYFKESDFSEESFEQYSELDELGRCGTAFANVGIDLMPTEGRGNIGQVKPSGWQSVKYDFVDGKYLYNRCHLIGFQLTAENANKKNLITGTRFMNVDGMLPFENMVADYIKETDNHVMYRVTPVFEGENLVASGVLMEAESVEDHGEGVKFNVYVYNVQPGITIDYATGKAVLSDTDASAGTGKTSGNTEKKTYVLNENTKKFHTPECSGVKDIKEGNKKTFTGSREELIKEGYSPCGRCKP